MVREHFGADYTTGPRFYRTKSKGAQEAHEAIRPTSITRTPDSLEGRVDRDQLALYRLIWNRTVASQMANRPSSPSSMIPIHIAKEPTKARHYTAQQSQQGGLSK